MGRLTRIEDRVAFFDDGHTIAIPQFAVISVGTDFFGEAIYKLATLPGVEDGDQSGPFVHSGEVYSAGVIVRVGMRADQSLIDFLIESSTLAKDEQLACALKHALDRPEILRA